MFRIFLQVELYCKDLFYPFFLCLNLLRGKLGILTYVTYSSGKTLFAKGVKNYICGGIKPDFAYFGFRDITLQVKFIQINNSNKRCTCRHDLARLNHFYHHRAITWSLYDSVLKIGLDFAYRCLCLVHSR